MRLKHIYFALLLISLSIPLMSNSISLDKYNANYQIGYEKVAITSDEDMGLVGLSVLFDFTNYWYGGVSLYGAVDGKRGGFFTVGADSGLRYSVADNLQLKSGLFLGAGGGGSAPQGGGLMLRPYVEGSYKGEDFSLGLGVSHISFPNGDIESTQVYIAAQIPTSGSYLGGHQNSDNTNDIVAEGGVLRDDTLDVSFLMEHYVPRAGSKNVNSNIDTKPYSLAGIEFDIFLNDNLYGIFQAAGAGGGDSDGYMEIFGGLGYRYQIANLPLYLDTQVAIGASGGGRVDTGGGLVYRAQAGLKAYITDNVTLGMKGGMIDAYEGTFSATTYSATLGYKGVIANYIPSDDNHSILPANWGFRMLHKSHLDSDKLFKNSDRNMRIDLLGFAIDSYINENFYLTGQTYWAYKGGAGGYAEGIFGAGYHSDLYQGFSLYTEALAGVGGGGGVSIGGGLFGSIGTGVAYDIGNDLEAHIGGAYVRSKDGSFSTNNVLFGLSYRFSLLEKKR